jgi:hypothetical protein
MALINSQLLSLSLSLFFLLDTLLMCCHMRGSDWDACYLNVCDLGTSTATGSTASATALSSEVASSILAARTVTIEATAATARGITTASAEVTTVGVGLGSSGLDNNVLAINGKVLAGQSSLVALDSLVLNKGTVLRNKRVNTAYSFSSSY